MLILDTVSKLETKFEVIHSTSLGSTSNQTFEPRVFKFFVKCQISSPGGLSFLSAAQKLHQINRNFVYVYLKGLEIDLR